MNSCVWGCRMDNEIKTICDKYAQVHDFSGVCLVKQGSDVVFEQAYGYAHRGFGIPNNLNTMFDTASVTKVFTATAVLLLVQQGVLSLNDKITDVIDLSGTAIPRDVTLHHLLTHTSGIADDADEEAGELYSDLFVDLPNYSIRQTRDFLPQFAYKKPLFTAGSNVRYNNCAFILLGLAIEKASGQDYRSFVSLHIFKALGMEHTRFYAMDDINENTAEGYIAQRDRNGNTTSWKKNIYSFPPVGSPDCGAYTTASDLDTFVRQIKDGTLLNRTYSKMLFTPQSEFIKPFTKWKTVPNAAIQHGYGFEFVLIDGKVFCMRKDGLNDGVAAMLSYYPDIDITAIILCNQDCNIWQMHRELQTVLYYKYFLQ